MYESFSNDYDRFVNWDNRLAGEMPFLEGMLNGMGQNGDLPRVLDAACGTGMHAVALAKLGFQMTGADLSGGMIERARANAAEAGEAVRFKTAGFGSLTETFGASSFDAILCLGNSLPHLLDQKELTGALEDFAACLRPGGLLLIQNRNFDAVLANRDRWMEPQSHQEQGREWLFLRFYDFLPTGLVDFHIVTLTRDSGATWAQVITSTLLYPLRDAELTQVLGEAGFERIARFGNLAAAAYSSQSSGNLVVAAYKQ